MADIRNTTNGSTAESLVCKNQSQLRRRNHPKRDIKKNQQHSTKPRRRPIYYFAAL